MSYGSAVLLDNSVWQRYIDGRLADEARARFESAFADARVHLADASAIEILYSAQSPQEYRRREAQLAAFPTAPAGPDSWPRARNLQTQLAEAPGISHRVKLVDLVLAAVAEHNRLAILHYDHDFDVIAGHTDLACESVWVAPRGSVG